jgi:phage virion morphogenesis protein
MSGAAVTIHIDDSEVRQALNELGKRMDDLTPAMQDIGETILESVQRNFEEHCGPDLIQWTRLSKKYEKWKTEKKGRNASDILILNRVLMGSINPQPEPRQVTVGTNVKYAAIHQFGSTNGKTPARPFLGIRNSDWPEINDAINGYLIGDM